MSRPIDATFDESSHFEQSTKGSDEHVLWWAKAPRLKSSAMYRFAQQVGKTAADPIQMHHDLHRWSISEPAAFWSAVANFTELRWIEPPHEIFAPPPAGTTFAEARWFAGGRLNYAENLLPVPSNEEAIVAYREGWPVQRLTAAQLVDQVAQYQQALQRCGVGRGDRVAGILVNGPEAIIAMLATTSLGAVWASCSPDFGARGITDRLLQIDPKLVFWESAYSYNGRLHSLAATTEAVVGELNSKTLHVVIGVGESSPVALPKGAISSEQLFGQVASGSRPSFSGPSSSGQSSSGQSSSGQSSSRRLHFEPMAFDDPLFILFSSGTTGKPKCIVHGVGGSLLQHKKELMLHGDLGPTDSLLYYTTCGWMMWNWMVSALSLGTKLVLFDGAPSYPDLGVIWSLLDRESVTAFGTSPKFLAACRAAGIKPQDANDLWALRTLFSTGAPLDAEQFHWVYNNCKQDLHLASICGGTDIISCFMLGSPLLPVTPGKIQYAGLGMAIEAWNEQGKAQIDQQGELVCTQPFPSCPVKFWNDPDGTRFRAAYFDHYPNQDVWRHGDYITIDQTGAIEVHGRSDSTLNPGGVRIGTAELYRVVDSMIGVTDSIAIGLEDQDGDSAIILLVQLDPNHSLGQSVGQPTDQQSNLVEESVQHEWEKAIRRQIRLALTPRHVPRFIVFVEGIPYTRSGKKVESAARLALQNLPVPNLSALENPAVLDSYQVLGRPLLNQLRG